VSNLLAKIDDLASTYGTRIFFITTDTAIANSWTIANQNSPWELLSNEKNHQINSPSQKITKKFTVNQHPPVHHQGWMICDEETVFC
jgi:hypothetical protein